MGLELNKFMNILTKQCLEIPHMVTYGVGGVRGASPGIFSLK